MRTLIVTPTYNERDNLPRFVDTVLAAAPEAHHMVVDDASPDGTGEVADDLKKRDPRVHVMHRPGKLGLGTAYVDAFRWGISEGFEWFVQMDADFSHDAKYLADFFKALREGADLVIGSRNIPGGGVEGWGVGRHIISKGGSLYSRTILGIPIRDLTSGYKAYTKHALEAIDLERVRSNGYSYQIETTFRAHLKGMTIVEVPIVFVDRRAGKSKMSGSIFREAMRVVWRLRFDAARGRL